jgi:hypothetical protein
MNTVAKRLIHGVVLGLLMSGLVTLSACGGGGKATVQASNSTLGKELQDLQQSYEKGIITQKEYESAKKKLMKKYTE